MARLARARPHRVFIGKAVLPPPPITAGVASFVSSGVAGIIMTATEASGGTGPYTHQWQRNAAGGSYTDIANGGGVTGATTLTITDGSAVAGILYGYRVRYTDAVFATALSNEPTAQLYSGGGLGSGGGRLIGTSGLIG